MWKLGERSWGFVCLFFFAMKLYGFYFFFFFRTWDRDFEMSRPFCIIFGLGSSVGTSS